MTVVDPRHPLFGRVLRVAERRIEGQVARQRVVVFGADGVRLRLAASALVAPDPAWTSRLTVDAVHELVSAARRVGLIVEGPSLRREEA